MDSLDDLLVGKRHVWVSRSDDTLQEAAFAFFVVLCWGGQRQISEAGKVCIRTVKQVVQTLWALRFPPNPISMSLHNFCLPCLPSVENPFQGTPPGLART